MSCDFKGQVIADNNFPSCGCKGIRTCLLCELAKNPSIKTDTTQEVLRFRYCSRCNVCWLPDSQLQLQLNGIVVIPEFISEPEQEALTSAIDEIPWMPSQSGRRKQDFGPKVNFKKRKLKTGNFIGFPEFAFPIVKRFSEVMALNDFEPVELCHLEYMPERGSAIEPHLDDSWLWGERLVTVNLLSDTVLTLTPCDVDNTSSCACVGMFRMLSNRPEREDFTSEEPLHQCSLNQECSAIEDQDNETVLLGNRKIEVLIDMPAKSLLVLSSCARHHWYHEIKRNHVCTRRLAMTFRELSLEFQNGGSQHDMGQDLLLIAKKIADL